MNNKSKLNIIQITSLEERVPPAKYGGTELVVYNLTEELVRKGHDVTLFASGDSLTSAKLIAPYQKSIRLMDAGSAKIRDTYKIIGVAEIFKHLLENQNCIDIIHNHTWRLIPFLSYLKLPVINTIHYPTDTDYQRPVYEKYPNFNYVSISNNQRKANKRLKFLGTIYNGIEVEKFTFNNEPEDYVAFLGRMSPEKGPLEAIKTAKAAGLTLKMAAKIDLVDKNYYEKFIKPEIDGKQIQYLGEVNHAGKVELLKNAKALLALISWEEPFGLTLIESLACGTPVVACNRGAIPELIIDGKTGFIVSSQKEAIAAAKGIKTINRNTCRKHAENNFSSKKMADGYERLYHEINKKN